MYDFFTFDFLDGHSSARRNLRWYVIYCANPSLDEVLLASTIRADLDHNFTPDRTLFLGTEPIEGPLEAFVSSQQDLLGVLSQGDNQICRAILKDDYEFQFVGWPRRNARMIEECKREGLQQIFRKRKGILDHSPLHHYIKPSGKHCDRFIRTANLLVRGAEVSFVGFWTALKMRPPIRHIYIDTASIGSVAYAAMNVHRAFAPTTLMPTIDSFSSYGGLKDFKFRAMQESYVLISASTSGELENELVNKCRVPRNRIITLFYVGPEPQDSTVLCDLTNRTTRNPEKMGVMSSYPEDNCPLCRSGSMALKIIGDQFIPGQPKATVVGIRTGFRPDWLSTFLRTFVGTNTIRCNYRPSVSGEQVREIYFDLSPILNSRVGDFRRSDAVRPVTRIDRMLMQHVPHSTSRIVYTDDPSSIALARRIQRLARRAYQARIPLVQSTAMLRNPERYVSETGMTLVVSGVLLTGRRLLGASQILRECQKNDCLGFLSSISRTRDEERLKEIRMNLQYGPEGSHHYGFHSAFTIFLPDDQPPRVSSWQDETLLIRSLLERPRLARSVRRRLIARQSAIDQSNREDVRGLQTNAFWNSVSDEPLRLRPNFALWNFPYDAARATHSEVYLTIAGTMHHMRDSGSRQGALTQHEYRPVLISPYDLDRYSDGIIQAAILRAAEPSELNYSIDAERSQEMSSVLDSILGNYDNKRGEAAVEIFVAIALRRLQLRPEHLRNTLDKLLGRRRLSTFVRFWCNFLNDCCASGQFRRFDDPS